MDNIGISVRGQIILVAIGIGFIVYLFSQLRQHKMSESHGLLWLGISIAMIIIVATNKLLMGFTHLLGAKYPASALSMIGLLFIIVMLLAFTLQITTLSTKLRKLVQELSIQNAELNARLQKLEKSIQVKSGDKV